MLYSKQLVHGGRLEGTKETVGVARRAQSALQTSQLFHISTYEKLKHEPIVYDISMRFIRGMQPPRRLNSTYLFRTMLGFFNHAIREHGIIFAQIWNQLEGIRG